MKTRILLLLLFLFYYRGNATTPLHLPTYALSACIGYDGEYGQYIKVIYDDNDHYTYGLNLKLWVFFNGMYLGPLNPDPSIIPASGNTYEYYYYISQLGFTIPQQCYTIIITPSIYSYLVEQKELSSVSPIVACVCGPGPSKDECSANFSYVVDYSTPYSYTFSPYNVPIIIWPSMPIWPPNFATHTWDFGDGSPYSHDINPTHTYTASGVYTVCYSHYIDHKFCTECINICINIKDDVEKYSQTTGLTNKESKIKDCRYEVFPNPANKTINILLHNDVYFDLISYNIYDISGRLVKNGNFSRTESLFSQFLIDVSEIEAGQYILSIIFDNEKTIQLISIYK